MADAEAFYNSCISSSKQLIDVMARIAQLSERMVGDATLKDQAAAFAATAGRKDLTAQDFDNFNAAVTAMVQTMQGTVRAYFYEMI